MQVPQLVVNYQVQSADGISLVFLSVWFVGDVSNLFGALWARLVPTVVALAVYFCIADTILILQCIYYKKIHTRRKIPEDASPAGHETESLLIRTESNEGLSNLPREQSASRHRGSLAASERLPFVVQDSTASYSWSRNGISLLLVCAIGMVGWVIAWKAGVWVPTPEIEDIELKGKSVGAELLGYLSAACYLG